jgi:hypothetical protein
VAAKRAPRAGPPPAAGAPRAAPPRRPRAHGEKPRPTRAEATRRTAKRGRLRAVRRSRGKAVPMAALLARIRAISVGARRIFGFARYARTPHRRRVPHARTLRAFAPTMVAPRCAPAVAPRFRPGPARPRSGQPLNPGTADCSHAAQAADAAAAGWNGRNHGGAIKGRVGPPGTIDGAESPVEHYAGWRRQRRAAEPFG